MLNPKLPSYFFTFLERYSGATVEAFADQFLTFVKNHLDPSKMRGQAYDGASNMSGKTTGTAAIPS